LNSAEESALDASLSEELSKSTAAENHAKEPMDSIAKLQADFAAVEGLKSDLMDKTNVELLEQQAAEQLKKVVLSENASQKAHEDHNIQLLKTVKSLEDKERLLSEQLADLEVDSTAGSPPNFRRREKLTSNEHS
jgi:hypothetical protein